MFTVEAKYIQSLALFMATGDVRYYLNGLHVKSNGMTIRLEATNGHCMAMYKMGAIDESVFDFIIPRSTIDSVLKLKTSAKTKYITIEDDCIGYKFDNNCLSYSKLDGSYPDCSRIWPKDADLTNDHVRVNPNYYALLGKAGKYQGLDSSNIITWSYRDKLAFHVGDIRGIIMGLRKGHNEPSTIGEY